MPSTQGKTTLGDYIYVALIVGALALWGCSVGLSLVEVQQYPPTDNGTNPIMKYSLFQKLKLHSAFAVLHIMAGMVLLAGLACSAALLFVPDNMQRFFRTWVGLSLAATSLLNAVTVCVGVIDLEHNFCWHKSYDYWYGPGVYCIIASSILCSTRLASPQPLDAGKTRRGGSTPAGGTARSQITSIRSEDAIENNTLVISNTVRRVIILVISAAILAFSITALLTSWVNNIEQPATSNRSAICRPELMDEAGATEFTISDRKPRSRDERSLAFVFLAVGAILSAYMIALTGLALCTPKENQLDIHDCISVSSMLATVALSVGVVDATFAATRFACDRSYTFSVAFYLAVAACILAVAVEIVNATMPSPIPLAFRKGNSTPETGTHDQIQLERDEVERKTSEDSNSRSDQE